MTIPLNLQHSHEQYPSLIFLPVDQQSVIIRPGAAKEEKGILSRIEEAAAIEFSKRNAEEIEQLKRYLGLKEAALPVPFHRHKRLFPHLLRPEMFLYSELPSQQGIPLPELNLYKKSPASLNVSQLEKHIASVAADFFQAAKIAEEAREYWLDAISTAYAKHSFITLAVNNQHVIEAVETMNKSTLLGLLKYPEDIAYWRHRVEIVLRPYRSVPPAWRWSPCSHEKIISVADHPDQIELHCETCQFTVYYDVSEDTLTLPEEINLFQAVKRIATIERQFNEIALQSDSVLNKLDRLQQLQQKILKHETKILPILHLQAELPESNDIPTHPLISAYEELRKIKIPARTQDSHLLWMAEITIPNVSVFHQLQAWEDLVAADLEEELEKVEKELQIIKEKTKPHPADELVEVKGYTFTREKVSKVFEFLQVQQQEISLHVLVQVLKGEPTNKVRTLSYHETELFALLSEWPEKYITKAILQLEQKGYLAKGRKGYAAFAEKVE